MPCSGTDYSCNSLLTLRSPLGEIRIGALKSAHPSPRPIWFLVSSFLKLREAIAHRRQRRVLAELDERLLDDVGLKKSDSSEYKVNDVLNAWWREFSVYRAASHLRRSILRAIRTGAERAARNQLRHSSHELSQQLLERIERQDPALAREIRKLFWPPESDR